MFTGETPKRPLLKPGMEHGMEWNGEMDDFGIWNGTVNMEWKSGTDAQKLERNLERKSGTVTREMDDFGIWNGTVNIEWKSGTDAQNLERKSGTVTRNLEVPERKYNVWNLERKSGTDTRNLERKYDVFHLYNTC